MAKTPPAKKPPASSGGGKGSFLTKQLGPLPTWGWGAAALVVVMIWRGKSSTSSSTATPDTTAAGQDFGTGYDAGFRSATNLGAVGGGGFPPATGSPGGAGVVGTTTGGTTADPTGGGTGATTPAGAPATTPGGPMIPAVSPAGPPPLSLSPPLAIATPADQAPAYTPPTQLEAHPIANPVPGDSSATVGGTIGGYPFTYGGSPEQAQSLLSQSDQAGLLSWAAGMFGGNDPSVNPMVSTAPIVALQPGQTPTPAANGQAQRYVTPSGQTFVAG